jgi:hypothetical protein
MKRQPTPKAMIVRGWCFLLMAVVCFYCSIVTTLANGLTPWRVALFIMGLLLLVYSILAIRDGRRRLKESATQSPESD